MHSELIPGLPIKTFGLCIAVGVWLSWILLERLLGKKEVASLVTWLVVAGIAGARAAHVVEYWHEDGFDRDPASVFAVWQGGLVFYGGLVAGAAAFAAWCAAKKEDALKIADALAVVVPLGHAFGRIGCFFHGCCWGRPSDSFLAVTFPAGSPAYFARHLHAGDPRSVPLLPTQLIESAALFALFAALWLLYRKRRAFTASAYLSGYGVIRFFIEFLRDDDRPSMWGLSSAQLVSLALIALGAAVFVWSMRRKRTATRES